MLRGFSIVLVAAFIGAVGCRTAALPAPGGDPGGAGASGGGSSGAGTAGSSAGSGASGGDASGSPTEPAPGTTVCASFPCNAGDGATETCDADDYCYSGVESPSAYSDDPSVRYGCNPLPADCAATPTCACVLAHFHAGFCTCDDRCGLVLLCSLV